MKASLKSIQINSPGVRFLRILVHGPVGSGKSSFINSIDSIFQERMACGALAETNTGHSFTKTFQTHYIKDQRYGSFLPFSFCDVMGLEDGPSEGVETGDLIKILQGCIKDGYSFNPGSPCSEQDFRYRSTSSMADKIHCLVSVFPGNKISLMQDAVFHKMKHIRKEATRMRIPQVVVLTHVDQICPHIAGDIRLVYRSKKIKDKMQECSHRLGVPMNCIFPVKNYHEEIDLDNAVDVLLLSAMKSILDFANDHVETIAHSPADQSNYYPPANMQTL